MDDFSGLAGAALVVGGNGGIGRAVVRLLARRGSDVALTWHHGEVVSRAAGRRGPLLRVSGSARTSSTRRMSRHARAWSARSSNGTGRCTRSCTRPDR